MNPELARRIAFTLGALLVYRIGTHIPLPGINPAVWDQTLPAASRTACIGMVNAAVGRGASPGSRCSALGITPYIIGRRSCVQLMSFFVPRLRALRAPASAGAARSSAARWSLHGLDGRVPVLRHAPGSRA